jgi:GT2 family glycosyltransferase
MEDQPKTILMIAMPVGRSIDIETAESIFQTLLFGFPFPILWKHKKGTYIDKNKCELVEIAKKAGVTHIMQIDADVIFSPFAIEQLVAHDKDIVGASYNFKCFQLPDAKEFGVASAVKLFGEHGEPINPPPGGLPSELFKCYGLPGGFVLIKMSIFDKLEMPYFANVWEPTRYVGEDIYFCEKARKAGFDIWCDPTIKVYHVGPYLY